ncbi:MAG: hypothetical protein ACI8RE_000436 [Ilumatobacter sp.]|jgi:hypothetical protein
MDFSKFKTSDWLIVGGGGAMFIAGFLPWVTVSVGAFSSSGNAFEFFFTGTLPWLLLIAVAVIAGLLVLEKMPAGDTPWPLILLAGAALATLLVLIRLIFNPLEGSGLGVDVGRGIGMFLGVIAAIAIAAGAFLNFQASGGELSDLTDMDKLKASFSGGSSGDADGDNMPPPPADTPPPPPPPAQ